MNLTIDPWIPALRADGRRELFSLQDLFAQAHNLRDLAAKPHERIALMRLLLCITQAALDGPADEAAWETCEPLIQPRVRDYLAKWKAAFELFGDGQRFLQVKPGSIADPAPVMENEGITRLNLCLASGESNATLFDNSASDAREFSAAQAALYLLTYQCYSPLLGRGYKGRSPCADESMLHSFLLGENLLGTIHLNLLTLETITDCYSPSGAGRPVWEIKLTKKPSNTELHALTQSYLGRLVPLARAIWLDSYRTMTLANALVYEGMEDSGFREATATVVARNSKVVPLSIRADKAIWRELPAICVKGRQTDGVSGPLALRNPIPDSGITIWSGAMIFPKKNAKIEDVVESTYSIPPGMFTELGRAAYERGIAHAEEREGVLIQAVKTYAATLKIGSPAYDRARQQFWTRVEQHLPALFALARNPDLFADIPSSDWGIAVTDAALGAYEQSCPRQSPRQIEAYALGLRKLAYRPKPNPEPKSKAHE
ncbi:MAG TPA: type I-E CRISPR-associated protein Cse1/CasA [Candidatus Paceibacterota bacterium]|nr:type I-E CRISPR-associated protein Cse1/CasA [Verrucomicrobiota bacterium]HRY49786.1 type I-E CRISPR-associated protein Cse1/CasA [Candidatus Paceibacterota bacterium]